MKLALPTAGEVIRYAYLWHTEQIEGREEVAKDRPCVVVLTGGQRKVWVAPITRSPPADEQEAIEIPAASKQRLGLDHEKSWIIVGELNEFEWPGPDIRAVPGVSPSTYSYGHLPDKLYERMKIAILRLEKQKKLSKSSRTT